MNELVCLLISENMPMNRKQQLSVHEPKIRQSTTYMTPWFSGSLGLLTKRLMFQELFFSFVKSFNIYFVNSDQMLFPVVLLVLHGSEWCVYQHKPIEIETCQRCNVHAFPQRHMD